jgi:hypothetical protein
MFDELLFERLNFGTPSLKGGNILLFCKFTLLLLLLDYLVRVRRYSF